LGLLLVDRNGDCQFENPRDRSPRLVGRRFPPGEWKAIRADAVKNYEYCSYNGMRLGIITRYSEKVKEIRVHPRKSAVKNSCRKVFASAILLLGPSSR